MSRWWTGGVLAGVAGLAYSHARARGIPFSPVTANGYVGADFPERAGIVDADAPTPAGEMDDLGAFARPDFDTERVHPRIRAFYEETAGFSMIYRVEWHRPFRTGAAFASHATSRVEQLNLPPPGSNRARELESRFVPLDPDADPRDGARAWVRTDAESGEAVFVALYAHHEGAAGSQTTQRFVNIAAPLPGCNLSTILRLDSFDTDADGAGLRLTTRAPGDPGLYLVRDGTGFVLPMHQRFVVWPADATGAPTVPGDDTELAAIHEMCLLGSTFLTVSYGITENPRPRSP